MERIAFMNVQNLVEFLHLTPVTPVQVFPAQNQRRVRFSLLAHHFSRIDYNGIGIDGTRITNNERRSTDVGVRMEWIIYRRERRVRINIYKGSRLIFRGV
jgi:hypothetical protein